MSVSPITAKKQETCHAQETFCFMQRPLWVGCHGVGFMEKGKLPVCICFHQLTVTVVLQVCVCECTWFGFGNPKIGWHEVPEEGPWFVMWGHVLVAHREVINHPVIMYYTAVLSRILLWWLCSVQLCSVFLNVSCPYALSISFFVVILFGLFASISYHNTADVNGLY